MLSRRDQGLGGSLLIYGAVIVGALLLCTMPILFANSGSRFANPGVAAYQPPPGASLIRGVDPNAPHLAMLKRDPIVTPGQLAAISAKEKKPERPVRTRTVSRAVARAHAEAANVETQEPPRRGGFFGLF